MKYEFSFIIPVYNRPEEIKELLDSFLKVKHINRCEILIVEDGSEHTCEHIIDDFKNKLSISYFYKENSGPGNSRNYGMQKANSDYFIILDSDVLLPANYIINLKNHLSYKFVHCFGGPDRAHESFTNTQKAINYAMTSVWTTGGIRGRGSHHKNFQPRSFNMGLSQKAFQLSGGFSSIHPGEDPDLSLRLKKMGFETAFFSECYVYHKRRIDWLGFYKQVYKFGLVRPILNLWHPHSHKLIYYLPSLFSLGMIIAIALLGFNIFSFLMLYAVYFIFVFVDALMRSKSVTIAMYGLVAICIQFFGYGFAFLKSTLAIFIFKRNPQKRYPFLFFKFD
ncbi:MAG: glycosyltransferase [Psychroflexus sp.]|nr:glycosyltransferase [Psychroflexus sp.]